MCHAICCRRVADMAFCWLGIVAAGAAQAAGGHYDVDDATIADPDHCLAETWYGRSPSESLNVWHLGGACRVGAVELGLNADHWSDGAAAQGTFGPQVKWVADPLFVPLSVGAVWAMSFDLSGGPAVAHTVYLPLTLWSGAPLQLHANAGTDWQSGVTSTRRWGLAAEWAVNDSYSVIAERSCILHVLTSRLGGRWNVDPQTSVDLSISQRSNARTPGFTIGLNLDFGPH